MSSLVMDDVKLQDDGNYCTSLLILPTELLVMILSYLSIQNIIKMQFVSQRFKEISETPSLWKKFVWPDCEPCHVCSVRNVLKTHGIHVRQICFSVHVTPANLLEMMHYCPKVTHLSLPRYTQLSLDQLEEILHTMTHLEQLEVFISSIKCDLECIICDKLLKVTTASVKNLTLTFDWHGEDYHYVRSVEHVMYALEESIQNNHPLPSTINILLCNQGALIQQSGHDHEILESYPTSSKFALLEISLFDIARVPMDLHPSILRNYQFSLAAKPHFVKLSDHSIPFLDKETFYLSNCDQFGNVRLWLYNLSPK